MVTLLVAAGLKKVHLLKTNRPHYHNSSELKDLGRTLAYKFTNLFDNVEYAKARGICDMNSARQNKSHAVTEKKRKEKRITVALWEGYNDI